MERITSFSVDHRLLKKGIYVSRVDQNITTFDIRLTVPNTEEAMDAPSAHTIEHIGATLLRNGAYKNNVIYFGPMGCMTGFYLLTTDLTLEDVKGIVREVFETISTWDAEIPGAKMEECGNYSFMNLEGAKKFAKNFIETPWEHEYHFLGE